MVSISRPLAHRAARGSNPSDLERDIGHDYRRIMGGYLRDARMKAGMTQQDLANLTDRWHTAVSAIESGRGVIPPELYEDYAKLLELDRVEFGKFLLRYTNPWLFVLLYGTKVKGLEVATDQLPQRVNTTHKAPQRR